MKQSELCEGKGGKLQFCEVDEIAKKQINENFKEKSGICLW